MANKTYAVHTSEDNISQIDAIAKVLRRSRNSMLNEGIDMVLQSYSEVHPPIANKKPITKKKAGVR